MVLHGASVFKYLVLKAAIWTMNIDIAKYLLVLESVSALVRRELMGRTCCSQPCSKLLVLLNKFVSLLVYILASAPASPWGDPHCKDLRTGPICYIKNMVSIGFVIFVMCKSGA